MTIPQAARGVLASPRRTFSDLVAVPSWGAVMVLCVVTSAASWGLLYATERGQLALVDQWERTAYATGRPVDDAGYAALLEWSRRGPACAAVRALAIHAGLGTLAAAGLVVLVRWRSAATPTFRTSLALTSHAGVVLAVRDLVSAPLAYLRETTAGATTLGVWLPGLDEATPLARVASALDGFVLWWVLLVALAAGVLAGQSARRWMGPLVAAYAAVAIAMAAALELVNRT